MPLRLVKNNDRQEKLWKAFDIICKVLLAIFAIFLYSYGCISIVRMP